MAKVFTITPGLENMGAMKTGGQGSVYKGRRIGEVITAIKLLPTPIYNESEEDKNYRDFRNEVQKLYKVNEIPNPNVVKILSSGLSETGNFPFIEMDYIEGPDLEELLKPPHDPVFTLKEVLKVAEHLSNALAHCHNADVKHGDIKSNNVKYNVHTGNYVLLDFGLAAMSDEQRRTSLRHAGAVEFMAPEQNEGQMLFETDVYSFGVIIFELLAGRVPFPLQDKGETARNLIRLSHIETPPPNLIPLRAEAMPVTWPQDKRDREMQVPAWLLTMMYKCLEKKSASRFQNGAELYDFISYSSTHLSSNSAMQRGIPAAEESEQLNQQLIQSKKESERKDKEIASLKALINGRSSAIPADPQSATDLGYTTEKNGVSKASFITLLIVTLGLAAFSAYTLFYNTAKQRADNSDTNDETTYPDTTGNNTTAEKIEEPVPKKEKRIDTLKKADSANKISDKPATATIIKQQEDDANTTAGEYIIPDTPAETVNPAKTEDQYHVVVKAYFYSSPDENTRRNAYMVPSDNAVLKALDDQNGFIYVVFTNSTGQTSKGWLLKKDLKALNE